jgi:hypothetical protein
MGCCFSKEVKVKVVSAVDISSLAISTTSLAKIPNDISNKEKSMKTTGGSYFKD